MSPARPPRRPRPGRGQGRDEPDRARDAPRSWGGVARRGARNLDRRDAPDHPYEAHAGPPPAWAPEEWAEDAGATRQLEEYRVLTGSLDQHPVLADCYRAQGRFKKVDALWDELRAGAAPGEVVTEGRIVAAGSLADRGDVAAAIRLLERGPVRVKRPKLHHIRLWYALGDLYERAGDTPRARELFGRIVAAEPDFADAAERLAGLG